MNTEHANPELFTALALAQGEIENASKNAANPHFKSKYADLAEVLNTLRPVLSRHGLSLIQSTEFDGAMVSVVTVLGHKAGGYLTATASCVPAKTDAQGVGSATTYLRRYSAAALVGIAQEDDDGQSAAHSRQPAAPRGLPTDGCWDGMDSEQRLGIEALAITVKEYMESGDAVGAHEHIDRQKLDAQEKIALWTLLPSNIRTALKKAHKEAA